MTRRRRPRHAALIGSGRTRSADSATRSGDVRPFSRPSAAATPSPDYTDPSRLAGLRTGSDGHTVLMQTVTLTAPTPAVAGCTDATVTLTAAAAVVNPGTWYGPGCDNVEWRDAPDEPPPSLLGSGIRTSSLPVGYTCAMVRALTPSPSAPWFRPCEDNSGLYERSLAAFMAEQEARDAARDRRRAAFNARYKVTPGAHRPGLSLDTGFVSVVAQPEFDRAEASR